MHRYMLVTLFAVIVATLGCLPEPDGCTPNTTRCDARGNPQTCSPGMRWTSTPGALACPERAPGAVCCLAQSPNATRPLYTCAPSISECITQLTADGGAP